MRFSASSLLPLVFLVLTSVSHGAPSRRPRTTPVSKTTVASSSRVTTDAAGPSLAPSLLLQTDEALTSSTLAVPNTPSSSAAACTTPTDTNSPKRLTPEQFEDADELPIDFQSTAITQLTENLSRKPYPGRKRVLEAITQRDAKFFRRWLECAICCECLHADTSVSATCHHSFHGECLTLHAATYILDHLRDSPGFPNCPICKNTIKVGDLKINTAFQMTLEYFDRERCIPPKPEAGAFSRIPAGVTFAGFMMDRMKAHNHITKMFMTDAILSMNITNWRAHVQNSLVEDLVLLRQAAQSVVPDDFQIPDVPDANEVNFSDAVVWLISLAIAVQEGLDNILDRADPNSPIDGAFFEWKKRVVNVPHLVRKLCSTSQSPADKDIAVHYQLYYETLKVWLFPINEEYFRTKFAKVYYVFLPYVQKIEITMGYNSGSRNLYE